MKATSITLFSAALFLAHVLLQIQVITIDGQSYFSSSSGLVLVDAAVTGIDGDGSKSTVLVFNGFDTVHSIIDTTVAHPSLSLYNSAVDVNSVNCSDSDRLVSLGISLTAGVNSDLTFSNSVLSSASVSVSETSYFICSSGAVVDGLKIQRRASPSILNRPASNKIVIPVQVSGPSSWTATITTDIAMRGEGTTKAYLVPTANCFSSASVSGAAGSGGITSSSATTLTLNQATMERVYSNNNAHTRLRLCIDGSPVLRFEILLAVGSSRTVTTTAGGDTPITTTGSTISAQGAWDDVTYTIPAPTTASLALTQVSAFSTLTSTNDIAETDLFGSSVALCDSTGQNFIPSSTATVSIVSSSTSWTTTEARIGLQYTTVDAAAASSTSGSSPFHLCWTNTDLFGSSYIINSNIKIQVITLSSIGGVSANTGTGAVSLQALTNSAAASTSIFHQWPITLSGSSNSFQGRLFLSSSSSCTTSSGASQAVGTDSTPVNSTNTLSVPANWLTDFTTTRAICFQQEVSSSTSSSTVIAAFPFFSATLDVGLVSGIWKATGDTSQENPLSVLRTGTNGGNTNLIISSTPLPRFSFTVGYTTTSSSATICTSLGTTIIAGNSAFSLDSSTEGLPTTGGSFCVSTPLTPTVVVVPFQLVSVTASLSPGTGIFPDGSSSVPVTTNLASSPFPTISLCSANSRVSLSMQSSSFSSTSSSVTVSWSGGGTPSATTISLCASLGGTTSVTPFLSDLNLLPPAQYDATSPIPQLDGFSSSSAQQKTEIVFSSSLNTLSSTLSEPMSVTYLLSSSSTTVNCSSAPDTSLISGETVTLTSTSGSLLLTIVPINSLTDTSANYRVCGKVANSAQRVPLGLIRKVSLSIEGNTVPVTSATLLRVPIFADATTLPVTSSLPTSTSVANPSSSEMITTATFYVDSVDCASSTAVSAGTVTFRGGSLDLTAIDFQPTSTGIFNPYEICVQLGSSSTSSSRVDTRIRLAIVAISKIDNLPTSVVSSSSSSSSTSSWVSWLSSASRTVFVSGSSFDSLRTLKFELHRTLSSDCSATPDFVLSLTKNSAVSASFDTPTSTAATFESVCVVIEVEGSNGAAAAAQKRLLSTKMMILPITGFSPVRTDGTQQTSVVALGGTMRRETLAIDSTSASAVTIAARWKFSFFFEVDCTSKALDGVLANEATDLLLDIDVNGTDPGRYQLCVEDTENNNIVASTGVTLTVARVNVGGLSFGTSSSGSDGSSSGGGSSMVASGPLPADDSIIGATVNQVLDLPIRGQFLNDIRLYLAVTDQPCSTQMQGQTYVGNTRSPVQSSGCSSTFATVPLPAASQRTSTPMTVCYLLAPAADPEPLNLNTLTTFIDSGLKLAVTVPSDLTIQQEISADPAPGSTGEFEVQPQVGFKDGDTGAILGSIPAGTVIKAEWFSVSPVVALVGESYDLTSDGSRLFDWTVNPIQLRNFKYGFTYRLQFRLLSQSRIQPLNSTIEVSPPKCQDASQYGKFGTSQCAVCPEHLNCEGSSLITVSGSYWRPNNRSTVVYSCEPPFMVNTCEDNTEVGQCVEGHKGPRCSVCEEGYGLGQKFCSKCDEDDGGSSAWVLISLASLALIIGVIILVSSTMNCAKADQFPMFLKIAVNHFTISSMIGEFFEHVPSSLVSIIQAQKTVSRPSPQTAYFSCATNVNYYDTFIGMNLLPVVLAFTVGTLITIIKRNKKKYPGDEGSSSTGDELVPPVQSEEGGATKVTIVPLGNEEDENPLLGRSGRNASGNHRDLDGTIVEDDLDIQSADDEEEDDEFTDDDTSGTDPDTDSDVDQAPSSSGRRRNEEEKHDAEQKQDSTDGNMEEGNVEVNESGSQQEDDANGVSSSKLSQQLQQLEGTATTSASPPPTLAQKDPIAENGQEEEDSDAKLDQKEVENTAKTAADETAADCESQTKKQVTPSGSTPDDHCPSGEESAGVTPPPPESPSFVEAGVSLRNINSISLPLSNGGGGTMGSSSINTTSEQQHQQREEEGEKSNNTEEESFSLEEENKQQGHSGDIANDDEDCLSEIDLQGSNQEQRKASSVEKLSTTSSPPPPPLAPPAAVSSDLANGDKKEESLGVSGASASRRQAFVEEEPAIRKNPDDCTESNPNRSTRTSPQAVTFSRPEGCTPTNPSCDDGDNNNLSFSSAGRSKKSKKDQQQHVDRSVKLNDGFDVQLIKRKDLEEAAGEGGAVGTLALDDTEPDAFDISKQEGTHIFAVTSIVILFLLYPTVVEINASALKCDPIDESYINDLGVIEGGIVDYFFYDRQFKCTDPRHRLFQIFGIILGLLWGVGTPLAAMSLFKRLKRSQEKGGIGKANASRLFTFLVAGFRKQVWWWEATNMFRKFSMIFVLAFVPNPPLQTLIASWVLTIALVTHVIVVPFDNVPADRLEKASLMSMCTTLNLGLLLDLLFTLEMIEKDSVSAELVKWVIFFINIGIVSALVLRIVVEFVNKARKDLHDQREVILAKKPEWEKWIRRFELRPKVRYVYDKKGRAIKASELTEEERDQLGIDLYEDEPADWSDTDSEDDVSEAGGTPEQDDGETREGKDQNTTQGDRGFNIADLVTYNPAALENVGSAAANEAIHEQEKQLHHLEEQIKKLKEEAQAHVVHEGKLVSKIDLYQKFTLEREEEELGIVQGLINSVEPKEKDNERSDLRRRNIEQKRKILRDTQSLDIDLKRIDGLDQQAKEIVLPEDHVSEEEEEVDVQGLSKEAAKKKKLKYRRLKKKKIDEKKARWR